MRCPACDGTDVKVIDSRPVDAGTGVRRRRECLACANRFTTYEQTSENDAKTPPVTLEQMVRDIKAQIRNLEQAISPLPDGGMVWDSDWQGIVRTAVEAPAESPVSRGIVLPMLPDSRFRAA